jgi:hypothetical protein
MSVENFIIEDLEGIVVLRKNKDVTNQLVEGQTKPTSVSKVDTVSDKALKG